MMLTSWSLLLILAFVSIVGLLATWVWWARKVQRESDEPEFELEKLVNCKSCGSLIPEGARKCAFCGSWQVQQFSGEQIKS